MNSVLEKEANDLEVVEETVWLDNGFPAKCWVITHPESGKYACFMSEGNHGLAVSSKEGGIVRFAEFIEFSGLKTEEVSYEDACGIAMARPQPIAGMFLIDKSYEPVWVKLR